MSRVVKPKPDLKRESEYWSQGKSRIVGIDEVGRGCLAGPVVVAGVVFDSNHQPHPEIRDSKLLSAKKRELLFEWIYEHASQIEISLMSVSVIDEVNILQATYVAMEQIIYLFEDLDQVLIDGRDAPHATVPIETIIKGDQSCYSIAAASIVAKVVRDQMMVELHDQFPNYDWVNNKGYGTKKHRQAILTHGPTTHHRQTFLKRILSLS